jgi:phosphatidylglycerophosphatase A
VVDDGAIVIDEFVGQWIVLLGAAAQPTTMIGAFVLFRLFDILKPYPVKKLERSLPGPWGVMMDDVAAGVLALGVLEFALWVLAGVDPP